MANPEYRNGENGNNVVETLALILSGRINKEDLDEHNQSVLGFYLGLMEDDPKFKNAVIVKKGEMLQAGEIGKRIPLYTDEELEKARRHRKHKRRRIDKNLQPELFGPNRVVKNIEPYNCQSIIDSENKIAELHREFERPPHWHNNNSLVDEDIKHLKLELRSIIGLPIARGKDPHVNDEFYKFLVKRIVDFDIFGIFVEFDDFKHDEPTDLDVRINQIKNYISEASNNNNIGLREKHVGFNRFLDIYKEEWCR